MWNPFKRSWIGRKSKPCHTETLTEADLQKHLIRNFGDSGIPDQRKAKEVLDSIENYFIHARAQGYNAVWYGWFTMRCMRRPSGREITVIRWHRPYREMLAKASKKMTWKSLVLLLVILGAGVESKAEMKKPTGSVTPASAFRAVIAVWNMEPEPPMVEVVEQVENEEGRLVYIPYTPNSPRRRTKSDIIVDDRLLYVIHGTRINPWFYDKIKENKH